MKNRVDPIVASVIQHRLLAIVEEMGEAMLRTSYSQILNSSRDFSTAICDLDGRLIAQAEHVPIHVGALPYAAKAVTDYFGDDIHPGDVFLLNDPYHGGNHLPDLTAFVPVFRDGTGRASGRSTGRIRATSAAPRTAPTMPPPPTSGRRASGSRRCGSTTAASCGATSST